MHEPPSLHLKFTKALKTRDTDLNSLAGAEGQVGPQSEVPITVNHEERTIGSAVYPPQ
jgi:hypothetical protein